MVARPMLVCTVLCAAMAAGGPARAAATAPQAAWWDSRFPHRVALGVPAGPELADQPVVLTGDDLYRMTGFARLPVTAVRVVGPAGKPVPMQVDQRDARGFYTAEGDAVLGAHDEIVFTLSRPPGTRTVYWVYWSTQAQAEPKSTGDGLRISTPKKDRVAQLRVQSPHWDISFNAIGTATPEKNEQANHARGTISRLTFGGVPITHINAAWGYYLPRHPFGSGPGPFRWTRPTVRQQGPVRTLVEMRRQDARFLDAKRRPVMRGDVVHTFWVYRRCPVIDAEFTLDYRAVQDTWAGSFGFPMCVGTRTGLGDTFMACVAGTGYRRAIAQADIDNWYPTFYRTPLPEEGWFAWADPTERRGLAVFYEKLAPIQARARWVSSRPVHHPEVRVRVPPSHHVNNTVTWRHRSLTSATRMRYTLRLLGLTHADGQRVRQAYHVWARPAPRFFTAAWPETR